MTRALVAAVVWILAASSTFPAQADGVVQKLITAADRARLDQYGATCKQAIAESRKGAANDVAALDGLLARPFLPFAGLDLTGDWQCRTIKLGGLAELVIYGWFKCVVSDDGSGWMLKKTTGSQRTTGRFYDDGDKRLIYLGSSSVNAEKPSPYGKSRATDQVGYAFRTGEASFRIELPAPVNESLLDIVELRR